MTSHNIRHAFIYQYTLQLKSLTQTVTLLIRQCLITFNTYNVKCLARKDVAVR